MRAVGIERAARDYPPRLDTEKVEGKVCVLADGISNIRKSGSPKNCWVWKRSRLVYSFLTIWILQQKGEFNLLPWQGAGGRPWIEVNAMLSTEYNAVGRDADLGIAAVDTPC